MKRAAVLDFVKSTPEKKHRVQVSCAQSQSESPAPIDTIQCALRAERSLRDVVDAGSRMAQRILEEAEDKLQAAKVKFCADVDETFDDDSQNNGKAVKEAFCGALDRFYNSYTSKPW
jgi:hypothetical protein